MCLPSLAKEPDDHHDNQLGSHQLSQREFTENHQPAAQPQQCGGSDGLQAQSKDDLPDDDPKVPAARSSQWTASWSARSNANWLPACSLNAVVMAPPVPPATLPRRIWLWIP